MGLVSNDNASNLVRDINGSKSQNSCILFPVKIILSKFGRNSCKFSPIRLQTENKINSSIANAQITQNTNTYTMRLLFKSKHFIRGKNGKPSNRRKSLSEKSTVSNWSSVAPIFSICGILYPRNEAENILYHINIT